MEAKYRARRKNPYRQLEGTFRVPKEASPSVLRQHMNEQIKLWMSYMGQREWSYEHSLRMLGPFPAQDLDTHTVVEGEDEYRIRAVFKFTGSMGEPQIVEFPNEGLKQGPEDDLDVGHSEKDLGRAIKILL